MAQPFTLGVNYWPRRKAMYWWTNFEADEVREEFVSRDEAAVTLFERNSRGKWQADLVGLARRRLNALGVTDVSGGEWCTCADRKSFYSHRREGKGGRLAALIWRESAS